MKMVYDKPKHVACIVIKSKVLVVLYILLLLLWLKWPGIAQSV
jgi:hypothetical protein